jgi:hypothetical protein
MIARPAVPGLMRVFMYCTYHLPTFAHLSFMNAYQTQYKMHRHLFNFPNNPIIIHQCIGFEPHQRQHL